MVLVLKCWFFNKLLFLLKLFSHVFWQIFLTNSFVQGAGEASADVPGEGGDSGETEENLTGNLNNLELNGNGEAENTEDGGTSDAKKKRRKRGKGGKGSKQTDSPTVPNGSKQTDPPTVPIAQLFPDGEFWFIMLTFYFS